MYAEWFFHSFTKSTDSGNKNLSDSEGNVVKHFIKIQLQHSNDFKGDNDKYHNDNEWIEHIVPEIYTSSWQLASPIILNYTHK